LAPRVGAGALDRVRVGAVERSDPIPPGFYWMVSIDPEDAYDDPETVQALRDIYLNMLETVFPNAYRVVRSTHHVASMNVPIPMGEPLIGKPDNPANDWILFEVTRPIPRWPPGTQWGFPNIASKGADTQECDVLPCFAPDKGIIDDWLPDTPLGKALLIGGAIGLATLVVIAIKS